LAAVKDWILSSAIGRNEATANATNDPVTLHCAAIPKAGFNH
jgi:hypothetical protein